MRTKKQRRYGCKRALKNFSPIRSSHKDIARTKAIENARVRGLDTLILLRSEVEDLEAKLNVHERWTEESENWVRADRSLAEVAFDQAIDRLEGLVVARMFELSKMNQTGTGMRYIPLRKPIHSFTRRHAGPSIIFRLTTQPAQFTIRAGLLLDASGHPVLLTTLGWRSAVRQCWCRQKPEYGSSTVNHYRPNATLVMRVSRSIQAQTKGLE